MDCVQSEWQFFEGELDRADVRDLLDLHVAESRADSPPEACHVLPIDSLASPGIRFMSVRDHSGRLLGIGALKTLGWVMARSSRCGPIPRHWARV